MTDAYEWTPEQDALILAGREAGITFREIGAPWGVAKQRVMARWHRLVRPYKARKVRVKYSWTPEQDAEILEQRDLGFSYAIIGAKWGRGHQVVVDRYRTLNAARIQPVEDPPPPMPTRPVGVLEVTYRHEIAGRLAAAEREPITRERAAGWARENRVPSPITLAAINAVRGSMGLPLWRIVENRNPGEVFPDQRLGAADNRHWRCSCGSANSKNRMVCNGCSVRRAA